jgi:hypothetical protein
VLALLGLNSVTSPRVLDSPARRPRSIPQAQESA